MNTWGYRIILFDLAPVPYHGLCEVFFDSNGDPEIYGSPETVVGETAEDVLEVLDLMRRDLEKHPEVLIQSELQPKLEAFNRRMEAVLSDEDPSHFIEWDDFKKSLLNEERSADEGLDNPPA